MLVIKNNVNCENNEIIASSALATFRWLRSHFAITVRRVIKIGLLITVIKKLYTYFCANFGLFYLIMDSKKPSGAAYRKMRKEKEAKAVKNTPKLTDLFKRIEGLLISHFDRLSFTKKINLIV